THPLASLRRDLDEESHPRVQGLLRRRRGISTGSAESLDVLALARADLDGDREKTGTHHSSALEDRVDERPTGAPVAVLEGVDGLELQVADGGEQQGVFSGAVEIAQEILGQ